MESTSRVAFKEWAVVVDALSRGEQVLILRKGGIHEQRGEFQVDHREFWLFPTQYHEAETSVIPSKRAALREVAAAARPDVVPVDCYAVVTAVHELRDLDAVRRLQGRHVWSEPVLAQRFAFGRRPGLHALVARIYRRPAPEWVPLRPAYAGCKSWIELERAVPTTGVAPAVDDAAYAAQAAAIAELVEHHAVTHP
jgi:hypothetical protein